MYKILCYILFFSHPIFGQWYWQNPLPTANNLESVFFVNGNTGWAVGEAGTIIKTTDGGQTWNSQQSNTGVTLYASFFIDENEGWIVAYSKLLHTFDGGINWIVEENDFNEPQLKKIFFVSPDTGFVTGVSKLLRTTNKGLTWVTSFSGTINDFCFLNNELGWLISSSSLYKTNNCGNTWTLISTNIPGGVRSMNFIDANLGYVCGSSGFFAVTTDGGISWVNKSINSQYILREVFFVSSSEGWLVGPGILKTTNGGNNWEPQQGTTALSINSACFKSAGIFYAVANYGQILKSSNNGTNWISLSSGQRFNLQSIFFSSLNKGWAVGNDGAILFTTNGGSNWMDNSFAAYDWDAVFFVLDDVGWIMGEAGKIIKTTNGGLTWNYQNSGLTLGINDAYFISETVGWACGTAGYIIHTTNGGSTWTTQRYASTYSLLSIYFLNENLGWAVGYNTILKTTNGGNDWFDCATINDFMFSVKFVSADIGYAVAGYGRIIKTTDGGNSWFTQTTPYTGWLYAMCVVNENVALAVGDYGYIIKTTDGGNNWVSLNSNNSRPLRSVFFLNENIGYVVGAEGTILRTENGGLPVELISFNADVNKNSVSLNWITATETNNSGFEVQKYKGQSAENKVQNEDWEVIGFVEGSGTTTEKQFYSFIDDNVKPGKYSYRLKQIDYDGSFEYSTEIEVEIALPDEFALHQNYPNPFNPTTIIKYSIPAVETGHPDKSGQVAPSLRQVSLIIYDILGNEVTTVVDAEKQPGFYEIVFDASGLSGGVYFYRLTAGSFSVTKKLILLK